MVYPGAAVPPLVVETLDHGTFDLVRDGGENGTFEEVGTLPFWPCRLWFPSLLETRKLMGATKAWWKAYQVARPLRKRV